MRSDDRVIALAADTSSSMGLGPAREEYPRRVLEVGIAEQSMVTIAAGLASQGFTPYVATYANFLALRCCEQIRTFVCYQRLNVHFLAGLAGLSAGIEGVTHLATEDVAIMSTLPMLKIVAPSAGQMTYEALISEAASTGPVYYRLGRDEVGYSGQNAYSPAPISHVTGDGRVVVLTYGWILALVMDAVGRLPPSVRICVSVVEVPILRPFPNLDIEHLIKNSQTCIAIEEGTVRGGLGTMVSEVVAEQGLQCRVKRVGTPDAFLRSGTAAELYTLAKLDIPSLTDLINYYCGG